MPSVLVVDDEPDIRLMLRTVLRPRGWGVAEAATGQEALDLCREESFDAIVIDQRMPGITGVETAHRLIDGGNEASIFLYSAFLSDGIEAPDGVPVIAKDDVKGLLAVLDDVDA